MKKINNCTSCLMPFSKDPGNRESDVYCSYCFVDGNLVYGGTNLKEFQRLSKKSMVESGMNPLIASFYTWMIQFAPRWKKK